MNTNWTKILLFSLLFAAIGFILGRVCGHGCGSGGCERGQAECHGKSMCAHGGSCCTEGGHCDQAGCDHQMGGACCKMDGHGGGHGDHHGHSDPDVQGMVHKLRESGYQGDTVLTYPDCTVKVGIHGDKTMVEVERKDSVVVKESH
ncbi:MAG TPA: hypothetical protein VHL57_11740 [Flavobacteriales bacterium]|jgi:hypothetical protein|nr:hypothetical protein [Flavobacteriales bacterium]